MDFETTPLPRPYNLRMRKRMPPVEEHPLEAPDPLITKRARIECITFTRQFLQHLARPTAHHHGD